MSDPTDRTTAQPRLDPSGPTGLREAREDLRASGSEAKRDLRQAGEDLRSTAEGARQAASEAASTVAAEARAAAETVKREGAAVLDTARSRAEEMAQEGVRTGVQQASGIARAIHRAADELQGDSPQLARTVHDAAGAIDRLAQSLRDRSPGEMLRGVEDMARRQPLAFFGAAALTGFALARFARSSATHRPGTGFATAGQDGRAGVPHAAAYAATRRDTMHDMRTAGTGATGSIAGDPMSDQGA
ncbi:hypothetical protein, partial [Falsiroseomonas oryzae]|uniref:hypothetical protein n=1 Tax=Falsiroseomonas oryzae TaxID=2766473 RepID=UPI0038CBF436